MKCEQNIYDGYVTADFVLQKKKQSLPGQLYTRNARACTLAFLLNRQVAGNTGVFRGVFRDSLHLSEQ